VTHTISSAVRQLIGPIVVFVALSGCGWTDSEPTSDRGRMIRQANDAYETAVDQGVDLRRTPCIFDDGGDWVVVVDFERRPLKAAASECPTFDDGHATHAVILNPDGEVVVAR
jgi:hypothetical protein